MYSCSRATRSAFLPATGWPRFFSSSLSFTTVSSSTHSVPGIGAVLPAAAAGGRGDSDGAALGCQTPLALLRPPVEQSLRMVQGRWLCKTGTEAGNR